MIVTTKSVFGYLETLVAAQQVNIVNGANVAHYAFQGATKGGLPNLAAATNGNIGQLGFDAIYYNGVPVVADEVCPAGYLTMLNTRT